MNFKANSSKQPTLPRHIKVQVSVELFVALYMYISDYICTYCYKGFLVFSCWFYLSLIDEPLRKSKPRRNLKKMGIPRNRPNNLILILKFLVDFRCFDKLLTLIGIRVDTFISLSFFDQILSADFWSQLSKLFGSENCYQSDYFDTLSSLLSLLKVAPSWR